jgi:hypothetical protein
MKEILNELKEIKRLMSLDRPVLSFRQFCLFSDLSEDYVRKLHGEGKLPFYRPFGKKLFIAREDAIAILTQNPVVGSRIIKDEVDNHFLTTKTAA